MTDDVEERRERERKHQPKLHALREGVRQLREDKRLSQRQFAPLTNYSFQYVSEVERAGTNFPGADIVLAIDRALEASGQLIELHRQATNERATARMKDHGEGLGTAEESAPSRIERSSPSHVGTAISKTGPLDSTLATEDSTRKEDPRDYLSEMLSALVLTEVSEEVIEGLAQGTLSLAEAHTRCSPSQLLSEITVLHQSTQTLLDKRLRLSQRRDLYGIESQLLAHACIILGDLNRHGNAESVGRLSLTYAKEAGHSDAMSRCALAKTFRWQRRYIESADMARFGFANCLTSSLRAQLASQEANAAGLLGNQMRAREALRRSQQAADDVSPDDGFSVWSFPVPRQAVFTQSVARRTSDIPMAHRATNAADEYWKTNPRATANWAQIRVGSGLVHLAEGELDAAVDEVATTLDIDQPFRVSTVTAYIDNFLDELSRARFADSITAIDITERCREFNARAIGSAE